MVYTYYIIVIFIFDRIFGGVFFLSKLDAGQLQEKVDKDISKGFFIHIAVVRKVNIVKNLLRTNTMNIVLQQANTTQLFIGQILGLDQVGYFALLLTAPRVWPNRQTNLNYTYIKQSWAYEQKKCGTYTKVHILNLFKNTEQIHYTKFTFWISFICKLSRYP